MDVRAILIAGAAPEPGAEQFAGRPLALLEVLGKPAVLRVAERMRQFGVDAVTILTEQPAGTRKPERLPHWLRWMESGEEGIWRLGEQVFSDYAQEGAELVLVEQLGPYLEPNYDALVQYHLDQRGRVTRVVDEAGERLGLFVVSASRRNDAAFMFRHQLQQCRSESVDYVFRGYLNRLRTAEDFRQLARDGLLQANNVTPSGRELKPGVWIGPGARIERGARLVAPCFIGERAKVRAAAIVTRTSALECHAEADCGAVVEDATLVEFAKLGAGLDCAHSVAGFGRLAHLKRKIEVEIGDPRLLATLAASPARRAAAQAWSLAAMAARAFPALFRPAPAELPQAAAAGADGIAPELQASIRELKSERKEEAVPTLEKARTLLRP